ncbi:FtsX-like permease family protein [Clostridium sp. AWRP]|uniref:ABC transporter permease n=1 Tax=Clostridium sp. AWRP TaxID=2212991 RepID=UPI000FD7C0DF|nr:FtsX-like permease family protein [Clostridium sp. AWRP]AZV56715.1 FtsX-like permease family protein [Clostridium sp. AWRP]
MKPLSFLTYYKGNKKSFISSVISISIVIAFLYAANTFIKSIEVSFYKLYLSEYNTYARIKTFGGENSIPKNIMNTVKKDGNVEKIIPFKWYALDYNIMGISADSEVLALNNNDINYFLNKQNITVLSGRLPFQGKNEIAVDSLVAKNRDLHIGDSVGTMINKFDSIYGKYKVVGILKGENMISIAPINDAAYYENNTSILPKGGVIIFPKKNKINKVNKLVNSLPNDTILPETMNTMSAELKRSLDFSKILDIITILTIFLMVITVGSSKYIQFLNRKEELGILNAIGYTKIQILKNVILEVFLVNFISYILGLIIGIILSYIDKYYIFQSCGALGVILDVKAFIVCSYIPLFTTLFTIIPVNSMINKLDPINMIEKS